MFVGVIVLIRLSMFLFNVMSVVVRFLLRCAGGRVFGIGIVFWVSSYVSVSWVGVIASLAAILCSGA